MVLEKIYKPGFLTKRPYFALLMGITYALLGIIAALVLFPSDPALIAVAITAILLLPEFNKLTVIEEKAEIADKRFFTFLKGQRNFFLIYLYVFIGVFMTFVALSMILPSLAANYLFKTQLNIMTGYAFNTVLFTDLLTNNLIILVLCFVLALVSGAGAVFLIVWNASVWGTIFGFTAKNAAMASGKEPIAMFLLILISVLPHMLLEIASYIGAVMSGSMLSEGIVSDKAKRIIGKVARFNFTLLLIAVAVLIAAMLVETFVLENFETYRTVIQLAYTG